MNINYNKNQPNFRGHFNEKFAVSAVNAAKKLDTAETISKLIYDKTRVIKEQPIVANSDKLHLADNITKLVKRIFVVVDKYSDDATEIAPEWHSDFLITNYKLGNAAIGVDTKIPADLFPGHISERTLAMIKYFTPERVKDIESGLFLDFIERNGLQENPKKALDLLNGKVKDSVFRIYERTVKKFQYNMPDK